MKIRQEREADFDGLYELIKTAFQTARTPPDDEEGYAAGLRKSGRYIPALALVAETAEEKGGLIGQIMLTKTNIDTGAEKIEALLLGPVSVLLEHRNKGVGAGLIKEALKRAKDLGYGAVFLCGDPDYYNRFGFKPVAGYGITYGMDIPAKYVMGLELQEGWLKDKKGIIAIV